MKKKVLKFWASWCGPCKMYAPIFDRVAEELQNEDIEFVNVNIEQDLEIRSKYTISSIPHTIVEVDGVITKEKTGLLKEDVLRDFILN